MRRSTYAYRLPSTRPLAATRLAFSKAAAMIPQTPGRNALKPAVLAIAAVLLALPAAEAQRPAIDVRLIEGDLPTPYTVVGQVSAEAHQTSLFPKKSARDMVQDQLREKAAKLGADAVIMVTYDSYNPM